MEYITGASGFLGTHLISRLANPTKLPHSDISTTKIQPFDRFFFLSAYGNMAFHNEDNKIVQANITDLTSVLDQVDFKKGFKSFVYVSSSSVRLKRQTMYSHTKRAAEEILIGYMEKHNVPICIVRPYSITGVGEQKEHLIPTLIRSCMTGENVNLVPNPVHDWIDVDDVAEGIVNLSTHGARGIFELGTGTGVSNIQVVKVVEEVTGKKANINIVGQMRDYDNEDWISGNFRARSYGWLPKKKLADSVKEMVAAYGN